MKRLIIILIFLTSSLFGQDNPMFDTVDYFIRNKIVKVHAKLTPWYYKIPQDSFSFTFDKKKNPVSGYRYPKMFRDTIKANEFGSYDSTTNYFDKYKRITKTVSFKSIYKNPDGMSKIIREYYSRTYFYADSTSHKIKKIVWETPDFIEEKNFYYDMYLLSMRTTLMKRKDTKETSFESTSYDYYPDKKLKRETRRVSDEKCPGNCVGVIEYTYETEK